jgi:hypothetical protein
LRAVILHGVNFAPLILALFLFLLFLVVVIIRLFDLGLAGDEVFVVVSPSRSECKKTERRVRKDIEPGPLRVRFAP